MLMKKLVVVGLVLASLVWMNSSAYGSGYGGNCENSGCHNDDKGAIYMDGPIMGSSSKKSSPKHVVDDTPKIITQCVNGYMFVIASSDSGISIAQMFKKGYQGNSTISAPAQPIPCK